MRANVRCAGGGQWYETWEDAEIGADRNVSCGWTGERSAAETYADAERLPSPACPECGGRVKDVQAKGGKL